MKESKKIKELQRLITGLKKLNKEMKEDEQRRETEPEYELDSNGNVIYFKTKDGYEQWSKYDEQGRLVFMKPSNIDDFEHYEYIHNGRIVRSRENIWFEPLFGSMVNTLFKKENK